MAHLINHAHRIHPFDTQRLGGDRTKPKSVIPTPHTIASASQRLMPTLTTSTHETRLMCAPYITQLLRSYSQGPVCPQDRRQVTPQEKREEQTAHPPFPYETVCLVSSLEMLERWRLPPLRRMMA